MEQKAKSIREFNTLNAESLQGDDLIVVYDVSNTETKTTPVLELSEYLSDNLVITSVISASYSNLSTTSSYAENIAIPTFALSSSFAEVAMTAESGGSNNFKTVYVNYNSATSSIVANNSEDALILKAGSGITLTAVQSSNQIVISSTGGGGGGGGFPPGGLTTNVQVNDAGTFFGDNNFVYNYANGNVGIKTSNPQFDLDVAGVINSRKFISTSPSDASGAAFVGTASFALNALTASFVATANNADTLPIGAILPFAFSTTPPNNWLACEGQLLQVNQYLSLYNAIQQTYTINGPSFGYKCNADGTPNINGIFFVLPDLRGEFIRGFDNSKGLDNGRIFGSIQSGSVQAHKHIAPYSENASGPFGQTSNIGYLGSKNSDTDNYLFFTDDGTNQAIGNTNPPNPAGTITTETRPANIALRYCIKYSNAANYANLSQTTIAGDVTGNLTSVTVNSIQGIPVNFANATVNQALTYGPSGWAASSGLSDYRSRYVKISYIGNPIVLTTTNNWEIISLNTIVNDIGSLSNLNINKITLQSGTYHVKINVHFYGANQSSIMLGNDSTTSPLLIGTAFGSGTASTPELVSIVSGVIVLANTSVLGIYCNHTNNVTIGTTPNSSLNTANGLPVGYSAITVPKENVIVELFKLA